MRKNTIDSEAWDLQDGKAGKCLRSPDSQEKEVGRGLQRIVLIYVIHKIPNLIIRDDGCHALFLLSCKYEEPMRVNPNWKELGAYTSWDFTCEWSGDFNCGAWAFGSWAAKATLHHFLLRLPSHLSRKTRNSRSSFYSDWTDLLEAKGRVRCFTPIC